MKFTISRLCGGKALMAVPREEMDIDMLRAADILEQEGCEVKQKDEMMVVFVWKDMETTLYSQGKVMFFPLNDKNLCIEYAVTILDSVV